MKTTTINAPRIRATTEAGIKKALKLNAEVLSAADHTALASAARSVSKSLRKSNPVLASHLYYVGYKHRAAAKSASRKASRKPAATVSK